MMRFVLARAVASVVRYFALVIVPAILAYIAFCIACMVLLGVPGAKLALVIALFTVIVMTKEVYSNGGGQGGSGSQGRMQR